MRRRSGFALWWILSVALLWSGCQSDPPSDAEETAFRFYKAVWVQGDLQQAAALLQDPKKAKDLEWRVAETQKTQPSNSAILITESPMDPHIQPRMKTFLIHREADKKDYKVDLKHVGGKWRVVSFRQSYSLRRGGYNSFESYQGLSTEHPHTHWKKIENP